MLRKLFLIIIYPAVLIAIAQSSAKSMPHIDFLTSSLLTQGSPAVAAEKVFKNIQVLKGYPADQVLPTMEFINDSLGVSCEYCHLASGYEKDDKKPKHIARQMMLLQIAINKDHFGGHLRVTCYSCHRGSLEVPQK